MPRWVFPLQVGYVVGLLLIGTAYASWAEVRVIPDPVGPIPIGVPFYGALGASTIGLYGVFLNNHLWQARYNAWYIARPAAGATLGIVAYLIFVLVIDATGARASQKGTLIYYLVAFLVGYREAIFRDLVKRAVDVLFNPAPKSETAGPESQPTGGAIQQKRR
jgi:hypothetical protein